MLAARVDGDVGRLCGDAALGAGEVRRRHVDAARPHVGREHDVAAQRSTWDNQVAST